MLKWENYTPEELGTWGGWKGKEAHPEDVY